MGTSNVDPGSSGWRNTTRFFGIILILQIILVPVSASKTSGIPQDKVIFAGDSAYPPFEWSSGSGPRGFNIDLARAISAKGSVPVDYRLGEWRDTVRALQEGEVDVAAMFISPEREALFRFTTPFYVLNHAIYGPSSHAPVRGPEDFAGQRIAVEERSFAHEQLVAQNFGGEIVLAAGTAEALHAVLNGLADCAIIAEPTAEILIDNLDLPLLAVSPPFWPRSYAFAVKQDREGLYLWLQSSLSLTLTSEDYLQVYEKWESQIRPGSESFIQVPFYIGYTAITAILLMMTLFLWSWTLRKRVTSKTNELETAVKRALRSEDETRYVANCETETGLARPHYFAQLVEKRLAECPADCELLVFKLVSLHEVRGTLGQSYSKELIQHITSQLKAEVDGPSCYFGRGIFALFSDRDEVRRFFSSIASTQSEKMPYTQFAAGSAYFPQHGTTSETLLARADLALSKALHEYEEWVVYDQSMDPNPIDVEIVAAFRLRSLEGMYAVFQPQINIESNRVIGAEALVRWQHPTLGALSPVDFIPLVEKLGFVSQVTDLMINEAVRLSAQLRRADRPIVISVNVSTLDLADPDFFERMKRTVEQHGGDFRDLKLELTETSFSNESECISDVLQQLKELGVNVSIDDFGTGYSSLAYLSMFPIQELKIDRSFVDGMVDNKKNRNIVRATLVLAEHLGLTAVAEGVEDGKTLAMLAEFGCGFAQGYFISKPMPEAEFLNFLEEHSTPDKLPD
ncbi:hypothetical protein IDSA_08420 [Pseudidiomarina salinarum]|uniref:EAL domain-containing protein n=1 Tax=Pseudidiomarina salinarum TaxID=435908 RepID=A0A094IXH4_9GAMM|nr:EAL domain-containing protein [Pseudidiomarina salinarum]KFZ30554.1 hypothetical protein IDSA_08420 [Pseudidiomarina salinarum]RUO69062.1 hypothetical protein CWI79_09115 [Pseudidiomarina salinarum]